MASKAGNEAIQTAFDWLIEAHNRGWRGVASFLHAVAGLMRIWTVEPTCPVEGLHGHLVLESESDLAAARAHFAELLEGIPEDDILARRVARMVTLAIDAELKARKAGAALV